MTSSDEIGCTYREAPARMSFRIASSGRFGVLELSSCLACVNTKSSLTEMPHQKPVRVEGEGLDLHDEDVRRAGVAVEADPPAEGEAKREPAGE